jgi:hypothetical protein
VGGFTGSQICFLSDGQLVVTFVSQVVPEALPRRSQPGGPSNLRLQALIVDAGTGQLRAKREWPTFSDKSRIIAAGDGKFLVITPDKLTLYSAEIQPLKELDIDVGREGIPGGWDFDSSPRGNYLVIVYEPRSNETNPRGFLAAVTKAELFDVEALRLVHTWLDRSAGDLRPWVLFDDGNILAGDTRLAPVIGPPGGPWQPLHIPWGSRCRPSRFLIPVDDRALFGRSDVSLERSCYSLARTDGEILFEQEFAENEFVKLGDVSAGGQRLAVASYKEHGGSWILDIGGRSLVYRIRVYDLARRQWVYALDGKKQRINCISGLALSSDGHMLALIDQDGVLRAYRVDVGSASRR